MSDLQKPLYSGLVMSLFILNLQTPIPVNKQQQAVYWVQHINSAGSTDVFTYFANKLGQRNDCASAQIDLVFLIDSSGSVEKPDFEKTKTFLKNIVYNLDISPEKTRVAVIRFADTPNVSFFLGDHNTNFAVRNAIDAIIYDGTGTATDTALDKARTSVFTNTRKSVASKVLVLVTDGKSNNENETIAAAEKLKDDGVTIFTIGVVNPKVSELIAAASEPSCTHFINLKGYNETDFIVKKFRSDFCEDCASAQIDLVFVIDSSGSVKKPNFEKTKTFLQNIVTNLDIGPDTTRVSVIRFSDEPDIPFGLGTYNTKTAIMKAISDIEYIDGNTFTHLALDKARNNVFTSTRKSVASKVLVLVTDGKSESENKTVAAAEELKDNGVTIFTIGVVNPLVSELIASASEPSCTHFINLKDYNEISFIVKEIQSDSCKAPTVVQKETPLLNITIPKTNETKQQVLQVTNTTKSTLGTTVLASVQCGVVNVYASFSSNYPNEADYDYKTLATDDQPGKLFLVQKSELEKLALNVLSQKRFDLNSSACDNPSYNISINPTAPRIEAACIVKHVNSSCTAKQLDSACYNTTPVVGEVSQLYNNSILKNGQIQEQVLEISNSTDSSGSTIQVSTQCAEVTVYGAFNNSYPIEADHDYKTSATDKNPGKVIIDARESQTDNFTLTVFSKRQYGPNSPACDHPSYAVSIKPNDPTLEVVCHRKQDERHCTPVESESKCSKLTTMHTITAIDVAVTAKDVAVKATDVAVTPTGVAVTPTGVAVTKQLSINAWIYAGLLLVWQMA
ncbi:collagen alpha-1(XII) chain isoform X1 [Octopus bimaculoides]|uniref:collagen alpha-1(XII) chain isoform X1 n=1 Tax=Octopus bimaculoides TaxID=37653 RepID=UPI0022E9531D|nr:collagen alpha-1(XII) chain isoform X1 [Octopus bimaculoides]